MKKLHLKLASVTGFTALLACVLFGLGAPLDAGACSCIEPSLNLTLEEVTLLNPDGLSTEEIDTLVASETASWPETASYSYYDYFWSYSGDEYIEFHCLQGEE